MLVYASGGFSGTASMYVVSIVQRLTAFVMLCRLVGKARQVQPHLPPQAVVVRRQIGKHTTRTVMLMQMTAAGTTSNKCPQHCQVGSAGIDFYAPR